MKKRQRSVAEYKAEIAGYLDAFARSLPTQIDAPAISHVKLPGNAVWYRETMFWRFTELAQDALEKLDGKRLASAILLTRAAVETAAALWYLDTKIVGAIRSGELAHLGEKLKQLVVGYKDQSALADGLPKAVNVLTFVDQVEKEIPGYAAQYAALCEYSHPNHDGGAGLYSHPHEDTGLIDLGSNVRGSDTHEMICALNLSAAVLMFNHSYAAIADSMTELVLLCEKAEPPGSTVARRVEIVAPLVDGSEMRWDGQFAAEKLAEYRSLVALGGLEGWQIIHQLLSDDWGPPPRAVQFLVNGNMVVSIPYDRPKRYRR